MGHVCPVTPECLFLSHFFHGTSLSSALTPGWAALLENNVDVQREISAQKLRSVSVQIKYQMDLVCVGADNGYKKAITRLWPAHPGKNPLSRKSSVLL